MAPPAPAVIVVVVVQTNHNSTTTTTTTERTATMATTTSPAMAVMLKCTRKEIEKAGRDHARATEHLIRFANEMADAANYGAGLVETNLTQAAAEVATLTAKLRTLQDSLKLMEELVQAEAEA